MAADHPLGTDHTHLGRRQARHESVPAALHCPRIHLIEDLSTDVVVVLNCVCQRSSPIEVRVVCLSTMSVHVASVRVARSLSNAAGDVSSIASVTALESPIHGR